jgi:hypothetical protein
MYSAWKVIHKRLPRLPESDTLRPWWLLILSQGASEAQKHPDQVKGILELLWGASRHSDASVSAAAAASLAQYPMDLLEAMELDCPLIDWVQVQCWHDWRSQEFIACA